MKLYTFFALITGFAALSLTAKEIDVKRLSYACSHGSSNRTITVYGSESSNACEVTYEKHQENPGVAPVIWNAQNTKGFCHNKALELKDKHVTQWGWTCRLTDHLAEAEATAATTKTAASDQPIKAEDSEASNQL